MSTTAENLVTKIEAKTVLTLRGEWLPNLPVNVPVIWEESGLPPNADGSRGFLYITGRKIGRVLAVGYNPYEGRHTVEYEPTKG